MTQRPRRARLLDQNRRLRWNYTSMWATWGGFLLIVCSSVVVLLAPVVFPAELVPQVTTLSWVLVGVGSLVLLGAGTALILANGGPAMLRQAIRKRRRAGD